MSLRAHLSDLTVAQGPLPLTKNQFQDTVLVHDPPVTVEHVRVEQSIMVPLMPNNASTLGAAERKRIVPVEPVQPALPPARSVPVETPGNTQFPPHTRPRVESPGDTEKPPFPPHGIVFVFETFKVVPEEQRMSADEWYFADCRKNDEERIAKLQRGVLDSWDKHDSAQLKQNLDKVVAMVAKEREMEFYRRNITPPSTRAVTS